MIYFELQPVDISNLNDADLRELVARLCEAELVKQGKQPIYVTWGGAQEAPDGGLDVHVKDAKKLINPNFVPRENTGFQVKKNSMSGKACAKEMLENNMVKQVIVDLAKKGGAYVIVSGKDDCSDKMLQDRQNNMKLAIKGLSNDYNLIVDFYGRDRLAVWLRQHPGVALWVRSRLGKTLSGWKPFGRWAATPLDRDDKFLLDDHPCVIDLNSQKKEPLSIADGIKLVRARLCELGSTVRITGLSGVGKTRFAQALFETDIGDNALAASDVIYADLGDDLTPTALELISYLIANDLSSFIVLDNCPSNIHRKVQRQVAMNSSKVRILTIEYDISDDSPEETEVIHIEPSSELIVSKLIQKRFPELNEYNSEKIAEFSGGNARIAIALASRVKADETLANFTDEDLFHRLFMQRQGAKDNLLENSEILSLAYSFNISHAEYNDELTVLAAMAGTERRSLYRSHSELLRRKISQKRGDWRAVLPHALANRLARRCLQNISHDDINSHLFKHENIRLFVSCAHRIGYLHDFEPARQLVRTWIQPLGRLHKIAACDNQLLLALGYIAPLFPDEVLQTIEIASTDTSFTSRGNENYNQIVNLLCKIAYDEKLFDRSVVIIIKFAESENSNEMINSIVSRLAQLFMLYLSGTKASPGRRQAFISNLLLSFNSRHQEIAQKLLAAAFETHNWTSSSALDFGARERDFGWEPKSQEEIVDWYSGYIQILKRHLSSDNSVCKDIARKTISANFRGVWSYAGCYDALEEIINTYASGGCWPEIWRSIKQTLYFNGKSFTDEIRLRLESLERLAAPSDHFSEMEAYIFTNTWDYYEEPDDDYNEREKRVHEKLIGLGKLAVSDIAYLEKLAPKLWKDHTNSLWPFGMGLANGSSDPITTFDFLVCLMRLQQQSSITPTLFCGFINGVHTQSPMLARHIQEHVFLIPELKPFFVYLLSAVTIAPWGVKKLIEVAKADELEASSFAHISYGRVHETISDPDLIELLFAVNNLKDGVFSALRILSMRFHIDNKSEYAPSDELRACGRVVIAKLLSMHRDEIKAHGANGLERVLDECFSVSVAKDEAKNIVELLCKGIETYRLYSFEIAHVISAVIKNFPEEILDNVFSGGEREIQMVYLLFRDRPSRSNTCLNIIPIARLASWCRGDEDRIQSAAKAISAYSLSSKDDELDDSKRSVLTEHIKALLDIAHNKLGIVDTIFSNVWPTSWSGSRARILELRANAFSELLKYPSADVQEYAKAKLPLIEAAILKEKEREENENRRNEQRFE